VDEGGFEAGLFDESLGGSEGVGVLVDGAETSTGVEESEAVAAEAEGAVDPKVTRANLGAREDCLHQNRDMGLPADFSNATPHI
jgi:hypothetical protein